MLRSSRWKISLVALACLMLSGCLGRDYESWSLTNISPTDGATTKVKTQKVARKSTANMQFRGTPFGSASYGSYPQGFGSFPNGYGSYPQGFGSYPVGFGSFPSGFGSYPSGFGSYPRGFGSYPSGFGSMPVWQVGTQPRGGFVARGFGSAPASGIGTFPRGFAPRFIHRNGITAPQGFPPASLPDEFPAIPFGSGSSSSSSLE